MHYCFVAHTRVEGVQYLVFRFWFRREARRGVADRTSKGSSTSLNCNCHCYFVILDYFLNCVTQSDSCTNAFF